MMLIKIPLFLPVNDENSFNQNFFLVRRQSGRVKRHAYSYVFLLRPPLPKARSRGGRQFFSGRVSQARMSLSSMVLFFRMFVSKHRRSRVSDRAEQPIFLLRGYALFHSKHVSARAQFRACRNTGVYSNNLILEYNHLY